MSSLNDYDLIKFNDTRFPISYSLNKTVKPRDYLSGNLWHEQIEIKYYLKGSAEIICDNNIYIAQKGDVVIINPCERHYTEVHLGNPLYHLIDIDPKLLYSNLPDIIDSKYIEPMFSGNLKFNNLIRDNKKIISVVQQIFKEIENREDGYEIQVKGLIFSLIAHLIRDEVKKTKYPNLLKNIAEYNSRLELAFQYINDHYQSRIKLEELARLCHMSVKYFCKIFKNLTGVSTITYINELRINKACILLSTSDLTVGEISERCGFSDEGYFSRCFKAQKDVPPQLYRRILSK